MSGYYDYLVNLWDANSPEFQKQAFKLFSQLDEDEQMPIIEMILETIPKERIERALRRIEEKNKSKEGAK
jgi:hypothetical protein